MDRPVAGLCVAEPPPDEQLASLAARLAAAPLAAGTAARLVAWAEAVRAAAAAGKDKGSIMQELELVSVQGEETQ